MSVATQTAQRTATTAVRNQRGIALLIVLVIVALLTITVTEFTYSVQIDQHRTRNALHALQAQLLARSGVNLAEGFLMLDEDATYDAYTEDWWLALQEFCKGAQLDETTALLCRVRDESGLLNVNNARGLRRRQGTALTGHAVLRDALRCTLSGLNINLEPLDELFEEWDKEPEVKEDGPPLEVPEFASLDEFANKVRVPMEQRQQLRNVLTAQPQRLLPRININTAPPKVLAAVLSACADNEAVQQIAERQRDPENPFKTTGDAIDANLVEDAPIKRTLFDVRSRLYRLEASALSNVDPEAETKAGIGQTLSVLVSRQQGGKPPPGGPQIGPSGKPLPNWTLRPLDWQKEGGARLFRSDPTEDDLPGSPDDEEEAEDANAAW